MADRHYSIGDGLVALAVVVFWAFLLAGTAYLVGWHGWSTWWFVPAVLLCAAVRCEEPAHG